MLALLYIHSCSIFISGKHKHQHSTYGTFLVTSYNYDLDILAISGGILICSIYTKIYKEVRHLQISGPSL